MFLEENLKTNKHFDAIDSFKGIAILMIVLVHTSQMYNMPLSVKHLCDFCQMGCQLFFVISGFSITWSWERKKLLVKDFYRNRLLSIAPGYWVAIILFYFVNLIKLYFGKGISLSLFSCGAIVNAILLHGLFPQFNNIIVPGGWYVGTTTIIYLLFPFIIKCLFRNNNSFLIKYSYFSPLLYTFLFVLALVFCNIYVVPVDFANNSFLYFSILNQLPCFLCGVILAYRINNEHIKNRFWCYFISLILIVFAFSVFHSNINCRYFCVPVICSISFCYMIEGVICSGVNKHISWLAFLGKESFGIYLVHSLYAYQLSAFVKRVVAIDNVYLFISMYVLIVVLSLLTGKVLISSLSFKMRKLKSN